MRARVKKSLIVSVMVVLAIGSPSAYAALTDGTNFSQSITAGTIATFIGDGSGNVVASPAVNFTSQTISTNVQTSTGTYGTSTERIYVDNPGGADNGWTLTFAATDGGAAAWTSGSDTYAFNGATSADGQLTIDASGGTLTANVGTTTGLTQGNAATFSGGDNTPVNLITAATGADDISRIYLTGVSASQTIPANTPAGTYTLDFTQTVTAI